MNRTDNISVLLIGFSEYEKRLFGSIATLTKRRARTYRLADGFSDRTDIFVVNGDDPDALHTWRELCAPAGEERSVVVSESPPQQAVAVHLRRPLVFTRVVAALDQVAIEKLKLVGDLVIGQGADVPAELKGTLTRRSSGDAERLRHRVLVVDDSPSVRKLMEIELRISGIAGDFAESADEAWLLLSRRAYDMVFLDVVMPGVDGYQVCKWIRKNESTKHTPVVMLTGKSSPFDRVRGKLAGCSSYLVKPAPHDALQKVFRRYLPSDDKKEDRHSLGALNPSLVSG